MSQSDKSDPKKKNNSKLGGEGSEPISGGPSADATEEVLSAVNRYFGIGSDPSSTTDTNKKIGSDPKINSKNVASDKSITHQDDSNVQRQAETSQASDLKALQSPVSSRNTRDSNSGRILAKTNSDRQAMQKQQGSERPSLDPTESVISAVTQYFGIGQDEKPTQNKISMVPNEQIVVTSYQVVDNHDSSSDARKQSSGSKAPDLKVPSTVIAKQKSSPEANTKGDNDSSPSYIHHGTNKKQERDASAIGLKESQKLESQQSSGRPSKDPTESIVSAVTQYFGIGQHSKQITKQSTNDRDEQIVTTAQNVVDNEDSSSETRKQTSESKGPDTNVPATVTAKQKPSFESSTKGETVATQPNVEQSSIRKQSQLVDETTNDRKASRRLTEIGETSSKRVTIAPGSMKSTTSESVVTAVTDFFGISHSVQSAPVSKTDATTLATSSSKKPTAETGSSMKDPVKQDEINIVSSTAPGPVGKVQTDYPGNKEETARMIGDDKMASSAADSKVSPVPEVIATPISGAVTPYDQKDKKTPPSSAVQPIHQKESESTKLQGAKDSPSGAVRPQQPQTVSTNESKPYGTEGTPNPVQMKAADSKVLSTSAANSKEPISVAESKVETPRMIDDEKQPDTNLTATSKISPSSGVSTTPTPGVVSEQSGQDSNVIPPSAAITKEQQTVTATKLEKTPIRNDPKQLDTTTAGESIVPPSSTVQTAPTPLAVNSKGTQDSKVRPTSKERQSVAASEVESPKTADDHRQQEPALTQDSKVSPSPAILVTPTPGIVGKQDSKKFGVSETTSLPGKMKASDQNKETSSKVPKTPVPAPIPEQPGIIATTNKAEIPRMIDVQKQPNPGRLVEANESPSSKNEETAIPVVVKPQDHVGDDSRKVNSSSDPSGYSQPISVAATGKPQNVAASKTETPRMVNDPKMVGSTKTDSHVPPSSPATVTNFPSLMTNAQESGKNQSSTAPEDRRSVESSNAAASKIPPISAAVPQQPQLVTANAAETQRTMEGQRPVEKATTPKPAVSSGPGVSTLPPPVIVNARDQRKNDANPQNAPEDQRTVESSKAADSKVPPISATVPQQPQPVIANAAETQRTMEGPSPVEKATTPKPAVSSGPGVSILPPPGIVNAQDQRKNDANPQNAPEDRRTVESRKAADSKVPPISAAVPQPPQLVMANAAETQRTMEGQSPVETATTPKPAVSSGAGVSILPPPVIVNARDGGQNDMNMAPSTNVPPPPPVRTTEPATGVASAGSTTVAGALGSIPIRGSHTSTVTARQCWICFATDEDELGLPWIQPCKCKGTTKWVHQSCLQMWVDEKLREHKDKKVACPQCRTEYLIYLPKANVLVRSLDQVDNLIYRVCPFIAAGVVIGSFYWNAVTYGAIVMLQVAGTEGAGVVAEAFQPTVIIVGLPFIPLSLIVFRLFQWEDSFLYILRTTSHCVPLLQYILPGHVVTETGVVTDVPTSSTLSFQRVLAGALVTPVIAKICGNLFFPTVSSPVWRTAFGGALFVSVKGLIKMYHKQQTYKRLSRRKILDYTDENKKLIEQSRPLMMNQVVPTPMRFQFVASVESRRNRRR